MTSRGFSVLTTLPLLLGLLIISPSDAAPGGKKRRKRKQAQVQKTVPTRPGRYLCELQHKGLRRGYRLVIPTGYRPATEHALVLAFHGSGQTSKSFAAKRGGLIRKAEAENIILVFPQSTESDGRTHWLSSDNSPVDDLGFILSLIRGLEGSLNIDARRIYATGFSNGGGFCHYLAVKAPDVFAAVCPVASGLGSARFPLPRPAGAVPIMIVNGKRDKKRLYDGGVRQDGVKQAPVSETVDFWVRANQCQTTPVSKSDARKSIDRYLGGRDGSEVILVTLELMTHRWPDGGLNWGFDANREVIEFFKRHSN